MRAYSETSQNYTPGQFGISLPGAPRTFRKWKSHVADPTIGNGLQFGPSTSFGNAGMFQNQWEYGTSLSWVKGRHTLSFGVSWDHTQLNIINNNVNTDVVEFKSFESFAEGDLRSGNYSSDFARLGQPLLSVRHSRRVYQRQLQIAQQPHRDARSALGLRRAALGEIRKAYRRSIRVCIPTMRLQIRSSTPDSRLPGTTRTSARPERATPL